MTGQDSETRRQTLVSAFRRTTVSFFWKLIIVAAGVGAYFALNGMEQSKSHFDDANTDSLIGCTRKFSKTRLLMSVILNSNSTF